MDEPQQAQTIWESGIWDAAGGADGARYSRRFRVGSNLPLGGEERATVRRSNALLRLLQAGRL